MTIVQTFSSEIGKEIEKVVIKYIQFHNESKGQWARYGKTALSVLKDAETKTLTNEEMEILGKYSK